MNEFLFLFRSEEKNIQSLSPDEMQEYISKWAVWTRRLNDSGKLKHGDKLSWTDATVLKDFGNAVTDGPYIESKEVIGGYMVILANDMREASEIAKECPIYNVKGSLEVRTSTQHM
ncbi:MAG: YciI family protein [Ignavibacteria bacterium]